jgi:prolyl-tRNA editing enzyme YbaK/EbsC (Cys-tRNA(Pro) deacylase)
VTEWPEAVRRVSDYLGQAGAEARVEEFAEGAATAKDAAKAVGCELGQIVKSLVFVCDGRSVLVLVPGDRRADPAKVAAALSAAAARTAGPEEVEEATGFAPGGVAPFALPRVERVLIDRTLLAHPVVWVGAGSPRHMAGLAPTELVRLARASTVDAVQDGA